MDEEDRWIKSTMEKKKKVDDFSFRNFHFEHGGNPRAIRNNKKKANNPQLYVPIGRFYRLFGPQIKGAIQKKNNPFVDNKICGEAT